MPSLRDPRWTPPTEKQHQVRDEWRSKAKYDDPEWAKEHGLDRDSGNVADHPPIYVPG